MNHSNPIPNTLESIRNSINTGVLHLRTPYLMLLLRFVLFAGWQAVFALFFWISGNEQPWEQSIAWWIFGVVLANAVCLFVVIRLFRKEGMNYWQLVGFTRGKIWKDALTTLGLFLLAGPIGYFPNIIFGGYALRGCDDPCRDDVPRIADGSRHHRSDPFPGHPGIDRIAHLFYLYHAAY